MAVKYKDLQGPKRIPLIGNLHQIEGPKLHQQVEEWAKEFGPVYKIEMGPAKVTVVTDHEIIQQILRRRPNEFIRHSKMGKILNEAGANGVFTAEGEDWKIERRIVAKGLDVSRQQNYFPAIETSLSRLHSKWLKQSLQEEQIDIQEDLMRFTVDVTTSLAFGIDMNTIQKEGGLIQDHMEKIFPMVYKRINDPIPWHKLFKTAKDKEFDKSVKELHNYVNELIEVGKERIATYPELRTNPNNLLEAILVASEEEGHISNDKIIGNLLTILMAGEDTTALTLSWAVYLLAAQPELQGQLHTEANEVFGEQPFLRNYQDHNKLNFARAVANETMRLKPVAPFLLFEPAMDQEIKGFEFKKGERILTQSRVEAMQNDHFIHGEKFDPSRWIINKGKCPYHNTDAYTPFGGGPRTCPGMNLAMLEMKVVLSMLFKNFKVQLEKTQDVQEIMAFTMKPSAFKVKLIPNR